ncbi:MAG: uroporphyrinogen decarboxylase family protein, partial [Candidatus Bathyarchaeia archaeon]
MVDIDRWIAKLRELFDPDRIEEARDRMSSTWNFKPVDRPPLSITVPPPEPWPFFKYSERFYDLDKMLLHQLAYAYSHYLLRDDGIPCVRADYGTGIIASGFGSEIIVRKDLDQMPWVKEPILKSDPPDISELKDPDPYSDGLMAKVLEAEEYFLEKLDGTGVSVYLCDTQSPIDTAYLIRGVKLFKDFYRHPDFVDELMERIAKVYVEFSIIQKRIIGEPLDMGVHGSPNVWMARGGVRICEDVAVMLSPSLYRRFCTPANKICLEPFDGGMDHFCCSNVSDGRHLLEELLSNQYIRAFF